MRKSTKKKQSDARGRGIEECLNQVSLKPNQKEYFDKIIKNDITMCYGPAGTSKTFVACYASLKLYLGDNIKKIILSKPIQESGEKLGFLPGSVDEKIDPFMESYRNNLQKIIGWENLITLEAEKLVEFRPLAYMRGATFDNSLMVLDEAQNADFRQLMLFITRMGENSKVLICGDVSQYDISRDKVALPKFIEMMQGVKRLGIHTFGDQDIVRNKILIEITERYEKWKAINKVNW
jgi:phosphate starvation-inducible PhoH-like protein